MVEVTSFNRATAWNGHTLAWLDFRQKFTELNGQYWGGVPSEIWSRRFLSQNDDSAEFKLALGVSADKWQRVANVVGDYREKFEINRRWSTLLTLVLLTSCFENYLANVAVAALASDPLLSPGFPKRVDGLMLLKHGHSMASFTTESITKGDWSTRISQYKKLFGTVPKGLTNAHSELDQIRILRNSVAHRFGFDDDDDLFLKIGSLPKGLSQDRLIKWFGTIDGVASAVEAHLRDSFIGDYETLRLFHLWQDNPNELMRRTGVSFNHKNLSTQIGFRKFIGKYSNQYPGTDYCREVEAFYKSL